MTKVCFKCGIEKTLTEFYKQKTMGDGFLGKCKECTKKDVKARYYAKYDEVREYDRKRANLPHRVEARRQYAATDAGKASIAKSRAKYRQSNPDKRAAHVILGNAVRDGRVEKAKFCQCCGSQGLIQGHHYDYAKPLDVEWLCVPCHRKRHTVE